MNKSLYDISLKISEDEYRKLPELSYSTLARFEREGFNNLSHLYDKIESPSLTFGSAVDALITGNDDEFINKFYIADVIPISDKLVEIVKAIYKECKCDYLSDVPDEVILNIANNFSYQKNWRDDTRVRVIRENCTEYYRHLVNAGDKQVLSMDVYRKALNTVKVLKESKSTGFYFAANNPLDNDTERFYQLKFKAKLYYIGYKCMMDEVIVSHKDKTIIPIDLKTSFHYENEFPISFLQWRYMHQARLYYRILKDNLEKDDYFKDFELLDYRFIVINGDSLKPLVWVFEDTKKYGALEYNNVKYADPFILGQELNYYLNNKVTQPIYIREDKPNSIINYIKYKL